jgi:hypothetical protein
VTAAATTTTDVSAARRRSHVDIEGVTSGWFTMHSHDFIVLKGSKAQREKPPSERVAASGPLPRNGGSLSCTGSWPSRRRLGNGRG